MWDLITLVSFEHLKYNVWFSFKDRDFIKIKNQPNQTIRTFTNNIKINS